MPLLTALASEWLTVVSLVFGGCCSNALALEWLTSENAHAGKLITFAQFSLVSLVGLRKHLVISWRPNTREEVLQRAARRVVETCRYHVAQVHGRRLTLIVDDATLAADLEDAIHAEDPSVRVVRGYERAEHVQDMTVFIAAAPDVQFATAAIVFDERYPGEACNAKLVLHPDTYAVVSCNTIFADFARTTVGLKPRKIPVGVWLIQVVLFFLTSLLNNAAFAYKIPMSVHIIFRSAGSLTNMIIGSLLGRRYTRIQILSVLLVTAGVAASTYSAMPKSQFTTSASSAENHTSTYLTGILLLSLALVLSSLMGLEQDRAYRKYGRGNWEEALFYLHFLAMPAFAFMARDLSAQISAANRSRRIVVGNLDGSVRIGGPLAFVPLPRLAIPSMYVPLALNVATSLVCVSGVHRLTSRVSSLTVTIVLVVRKAVSLWITVILLGRGDGGAWLWGGALAVLAGTILYALDGQRAPKEKEKKD
ncbi:UAA-domain-containing protein [Auricularia subglabra TFB-10046 SS5]|nr:UAA-domain-containing protein [Auricularia subglabra TFB-10046 SS5]